MALYHVDEKLLKLFNVDSGKLLTSWRIEPKDFNLFATADGKHLLFSDDISKTHVINLENGVKTEIQLCYNISQLDDGTLYNTEINGNSVSQIEIISNKIRTKQKMHVPIQPVLRFNMSAFAAGAKYFICKGEVWDLKTQKRVSNDKLASIYNIDRPKTYYGNYMVYKHDFTMFDLRQPSVEIKSLISNSTSSQCLFLTATVYGCWEKYDGVVQVRMINSGEVKLTIHGQYLGNSDNYLAMQRDATLEIYDIRRFCLTTSINIKAGNNMENPKAIFFNVKQDLREKIIAAKSYRDVSIKCLDEI
jgi:hypothetical protein